ncbi:MAG: hypothetical protein ACLGJC_09485 [Alphaproteobacteria bacterium]
MSDTAKLLGAWVCLYALVLICGIGATAAAYGLYRIAHSASLLIGGP